MHDGKFDADRRHERAGGGGGGGDVRCACVTGALIK